jgi:predicted HAD superfamily Cof-like phosphohydrolase
MKEEIKMVRDFHEAFKHPVREFPRYIGGERAVFRHTLLQEEVTELLVASTSGDMINIADAIGDCLYILFGTAHEFGLAERLPAIFAEIHRSNMTKLVDGKPIYHENGKVKKPETYEKPDLMNVIYCPKSE